MERNCLRTVYRTSLTNTTIGGGGGGGANATALKSQRNKLCRAGEEDFINGISWPPRSYTCNFCKREFKSAQALGGHMNVHRRDRALLYSPPADGQFTNLNLNLHHNPNPNIPSHDDIAAFGRPSDRKASNHFKSSSTAAEIAKPNISFERGHWKRQGEKFIGLDIEISTTTTLFTESKKDIDLELRLGYSA